MNSQLLRRQNSFGLENKSMEKLKKVEKLQIPPILAYGAPPFLLLILNFFAPRK